MSNVYTPSWTGFNKTEPAIEPVTVSEVKEYLEITQSYQDDMLSGMIIGARDAVEKYLGRQLITSIYNVYYDCYERMYELPYSPLQSVSAFQYKDESGTEQVIPTSGYIVDDTSLIPRVQINPDYNMPTLDNTINRLHITYIAGFGDTADDIPASIKICIKMLVAALYENREADLQYTINSNNQYKFLLNSYKVTSFY